MKMQTRLLAVGLVLICVPMFAHAEVNLPKLSGAVVRSVVSREENPPDAFRYYYRVDNSGGTLSVVSMTLDLQSDPSRVVVSAEGLDDTAGSYLPSTASFRAEFGSQGLVGVAFPTTPPGWDVSIDAAAAGQWGFSFAGQPIEPGASVEGFVLLSRALPGIRSVTLEAELWDALVQHDDESPEVLVEALDDAALRVLTVGPVALPEGSTPGSLAAGIDSLREQARAQGWIATDDASTNIAALLSTLRVALDENRIPDAKIAARDFLQLVESSSCTTLDCTGKPLTSEAYALMRFNMEYLLAMSAGIAISIAAQADECRAPIGDMESAKGCRLEFGSFPLQPPAHSELSFFRGASLDKVISAYGEPKSKQIRQVTDPYESEDSATYVELTYPDGRIQLSCSSSEADCWIQTFETSNSSSDLGCGLRIGQPVHEFVTKLEAMQDLKYSSPGSKKLDISWDKYWCEEGIWFARHASITLNLAADDSVERISWGYFAD